MNFLDKLPAWLRHLLIVVGVAALTTISQGFSNGGVDHISWKDVLNAVVAAAVGYGLLALTPLTRQYGVGAPPPPGEPVIEGDDTP
jgi:uncharacterized membrane protein